MTELERRALMGDRKAQEECTRQGIVLPCPCCKNKSELLAEESAFDGEAPRVFHYIRCKSCFLKSGLYTSVTAVLNKWNTRPAPPVGRCGECGHLDDTGSKPVCWHTGKPFKSKDGYCDEFKPKESEGNAAGRFGFS